MEPQKRTIWFAALLRDIFSTAWVVWVPAFAGMTVFNIAVIVTIAHRGQRTANSEQQQRTATANSG
jgi:hypothetical protein